MKTTNTSEIRNALNKRVITFTYIKNNGEVRNAKGTTNVELIQNNSAFCGFKGGESKVKDSGYISYFDVDKCHWRCFSESHLIEADI